METERLDSTMTADRRTAGQLFLAAFVAYAWFFSGGGFNQNVNFDLARALVERQTFHIDGYHVNTWDISDNRGHIYSNKPPGLSFLAAIPYAPLYWLELAAHRPVNSWFYQTLNAYLLTVLTCGLTGALIPAVIFLYARRRFDASPKAAVMVSLAMAFGTIAFPYATMLFAHVPSAFFLLLAFVLIDRRPLVAGAAAGVAGITYLLCIPAAAGLLLLARSRRQVLLYLAGGVPFGLLLGWYQYVCFGSPFRTSLESSPTFTQAGLLFGVFRQPSLDAMWKLLVPPYRGLFFASPILLFAVIGAAFMVRRRDARRELLVVTALFLFFLLVVSSFNGWHGGSSWGPRYLLSVLPLLGIPMLFATHLLRPLWVLLGVVSVAFQLLATSVDPMPGQGTPNPVRDYFLPAFLTGNLPPDGRHVGKVSINEQAIDDVGGYTRHPRGSHEALWASFNLGELLVGATRRTSVLPIVAWIAAWSVILLRRKEIAA